MAFEKCRLSLKSPSTPNSITNNNDETFDHEDPNQKPNHKDKHENVSHTDHSDITVIEPNEDDHSDNSDDTVIEDLFQSELARKDSFNPYIVRGVDMTEDELASHRAKLEELQLKQRLMEEQNKKRKEMLSKALADR